MAVALAFVDVRFAQRGDAVFQHGARVGVHDAGCQAFLFVLDVGDAVVAVFGEEGGPRLQRIAVDGVGVAGVEGGDGQQIDHAQASMWWR